MARINDHYLKLAAGYLFPEIGRRVHAFQVGNPDAKIIRLGIGDVVLPLPASVREAMHRAVDELGTEEGFHGYGPEQGYAFLREAIVEHEFRARGVEIRPDEVFVSDGSKCDSANIQEIFSTHARVAVPDPVYHEIGYAFVLPVSGGAPDPATLADHCRARLAGYKIPRRFIVRDILPMLEIGKIDRRALAAEARALAATDAAP